MIPATSFRPQSEREPETVTVDGERLALAVTYHAHQGGCCDGVRPGESLSEHAIDVALGDDDPVPARYR